MSPFCISLNISERQNVCDAFRIEPHSTIFVQVPFFVTNVFVAKRYQIALGIANFFDLPVDAVVNVMFN